MSYGKQTLYSDIKNNSTITALLDSSSGNPYVSSNPVMPSTWGTNTKAINLYKVSPIDLGISYGEYLYTVNCRAGNDADAEEIAETTAEELNRASITGGGRYYCSILPVIIPLNDADDYNVPVGVTIKTNQDLP